MKNTDATEQAYKNGYEQGKKDAEDEIQILKQKRANMFEILDAYERGQANALKWIPVSERLPEAHKLVLCLWVDSKGNHYGFARYQHDDVWYVSNEGMPEVTHWMPLPSTEGLE